MNGTDNRFAEYIIWRTNEKQASLHIAVMCYEGLIGVLGAFGNGVIIYVYGCKLGHSGTNTYVLWIAITDMIMASVGIPIDMLNLRFPLFLGYSLPCKFHIWMDSSLFCTGVLMCLVIAVDRYYKVCRPMSRAARCKPRVYVVASFGISFAIMSPFMVLYGTKVVETPVSGITGIYCYFSDSMSDVIYLSFLFLVVFGATTVGLILYICISIGIWRWKHNVVGEAKKSHNNLKDGANKERKKHSTEADEVGNVQPENKANTSIHSKGVGAEQKALAEIAIVECRNDEVENLSDLRTATNITPIQPKRKTPVVRRNVKDWSTRPSTAKDRARIGRSALMFFILMMTYYVSYIPYFTIFILRYTGQLNLEEVSYSSRQVLEILERTYYMAAVVNPLIYNTLHPQFRREVVHMFKQ
jgi:cholecystokinin A receptor